MGEAYAGLRVAVLGTGANGTAIAVDLVRAGWEVTLIDQWPANVRAVRSRGAVVECDGERTVTSLTILELAAHAAIPPRTFAVVLLGVKAVISESYARIHGSNLVGMGVLPLKFVYGADW